MEKGERLPQMPQMQFWNCFMPPMIEGGVGKVRKKLKLPIGIENDGLESSST